MVDVNGDSLEVRGRWFGITPKRPKRLPTHKGICQDDRTGGVFIEMVCSRVTRLCLHCEEELCTQVFGQVLRAGALTCMVVVGSPLFPVCRLYTVSILRSHCMHDAASLRKTILREPNEEN